MIKDFDHVHYDPGVAKWTLSSTLVDDRHDAQFDRAVETIESVLDAFGSLVRPTVVEYGLHSATDGGAEPVERTLTDDSGLSAREVLASFREDAERYDVPEFGSFHLRERVRLTLADGTHYVAGPDSPVVERSGAHDDARAPVVIHVRQHDVMLPTTTTIVEVTGNTDHWFDHTEVPGGRETESPFARINQRRLAGALTRLYDGVEPDVLEESAGSGVHGDYAVSWLPGDLRLDEYHDVEWTLRNCTIERSGESALEVHFDGEWVDWSSFRPLGRIRGYLDRAHPESEYGDLERAMVHLPDREVELTRSSRGGWALTE